MKRFITGFGSFIITIAMAYALFVGSSHDRALSKAGMGNGRGLSGCGVRVFSGENDHKDPYEVYYCFQISGTDVQTMSIALITKTPFLGWVLTKRAVSELGDTGISMTFGKSSEIGNYGFEKHIVYLGNNALSRIENISDLLPPNVTADIYSNDSSPYYYLHFMSFDEYEINPEEILRQKGYIE